MSETWLKLFWDLFIHSAIWRPFLYYTLVVKGSILFLTSSLRFPDADADADCDADADAHGGDERAMFCNEKFLLKNSSPCVPLGIIMIQK